MNSNAKILVLCLLILSAADFVSAATCHDYSMSECHTHWGCIGQTIVSGEGSIEDCVTCSSAHVSRCSDYNGFYMPTEACAADPCRPQQSDAPRCEWRSQCIEKGGTPVYTLTVNPETGLYAANIAVFDSTDVVRAAKHGTSASFSNMPGGTYQVFVCFGDKNLFSQTVNLDSDKNVPAPLGSDITPSLRGDVHISGTLKDGLTDYYVVAFQAGNHVQVVDQMYASGNSFDLGHLKAGVNYDLYVYKVGYKALYNPNIAPYTTNAVVELGSGGGGGGTGTVGSVVVPPINTQALDELETALMTIAAFIALVMIVIHGLKYLMAQSPQTREDAKQGIVYVILGLLLVVMATVLVKNLYTANIEAYTSQIPDYTGGGGTGGGDTGGGTGADVCNQRCVAGVMPCTGGRCMVAHAEVLGGCWYDNVGGFNNCWECDGSSEKPAISSCSGYNNEGACYINSCRVSGGCHWDGSCKSGRPSTYPKDYCNVQCGSYCTLTECHQANAYVEGGCWFDGRGFNNCHSCKWVSATDGDFTVHACADYKSPEDCKSGDPCGVGPCKWESDGCTPA